MSRLDDMLERYGEIITQTGAAKILGCSARTISRMLHDGQLRTVGNKVDVRSICEYIESNMRDDRSTKRPIKPGKCRFRI